MRCCGEATFNEILLNHSAEEQCHEVQEMVVEHLVLAQRLLSIKALDRFHVGNGYFLATTLRFSLLDSIVNQEDVLFLNIFTVKNELWTEPSYLLDQVGGTHSDALFLVAGDVVLHDPTETFI